MSAVVRVTTTLRAFPDKAKKNFPGASEPE